MARYSGVSSTTPVAPLVAGNTNGINGACANGMDSAAYSFNVTTNQANALVFGVVAMRTQTNTPGAGYTERAEMTQSTGANMVSIAFIDRAVPTADVTATERDVERRGGLGGRLAFSCGP